jgi:hypothetical protein
MDVRHRLENSFRTDGGVFGSVHFGKQHDEFIAALAAHRVGTAHAFHQPPGDRPEKLVARRMPQGIIDMLEAVQIQEQHRQLRPVARRQGDRELDPLLQEGTIGQAGQVS